MQQQVKLLQGIGWPKAAIREVLAKHANALPQLQFADCGLQLGPDGRSRLSWVLQGLAQDTLGGERAELETYIDKLVKLVQVGQAQGSSSSRCRQSVCSQCWRQVQQQQQQQQQRSSLCHQRHSSSSSCGSVQPCWSASRGHGSSCCTCRGRCQC